VAYCASYTFIGGFLAVSRTDVFQALLMLGGFIVLPMS
jgi:Na+/proline symporter